MYTSKGPTHFFKPVSHDGTVQNTTVREDNVHKLASPGTHILMQSPSNVILTDIEEENLSSDSPQAYLIRWHYCLGNCLFTWLRLLAALGILPRKILKSKSPKCAGCLYGAMEKRPWRTKSAKNRGSIWEASAPGECISFYQMESRTPGFIAHQALLLRRNNLPGSLQWSDLRAPAERIIIRKTVEAKKSFEAYAQAYRVKVKHYHTDNGRFA